jgi:subtilisin family serine protease
MVVGLIDGPVAVNHPDLARGNIRELDGAPRDTGTQVSNAARLHGTFVAGILGAKRGSDAPAICPTCTLLVRPIFAETAPENGQIPSATPEELATALLECIAAGARVINLSSALVGPPSSGQRALAEILDLALRRGVLVVVAAGNQGTLASSVITRHPWVLPVVAYDLDGKPMDQSNVGHSIGRRGLGAPGDAITSLGAQGPPLTLAGTSAATPFVTGAIALLWSEFPGATAAEVKDAICRAAGPRRTTVVPPLLDAWRAYQLIAMSMRRRRT